MHKFILTMSSILVLTMVSACVAKPEAVHPDSQKSTLISQAYIKPGAGIGYTHDLKSQYSVGEIVSFQLQLGEIYDKGTMLIKVTAEGVQGLAPSSPVSFDMGAGGDHDMTVSFTAVSNGRHYINVQALADIGDGNPMSRVFSIPVQVGPVTAQKPNADMKTMPDGETIIEMDAQEEIK